MNSGIKSPNRWVWQAILNILKREEIYFASAQTYSNKPTKPNYVQVFLKRENQRFTFEFFYIISMKTAFLTCWWMQSTTEFEFLLRNFHICSYKLCIPRKWNYFYKMHFYFNNYWNSARTTILKKVPQKGQKGKK